MRGDKEGTGGRQECEGEERGDIMKLDSFIFISIFV